MTYLPHHRNQFTDPSENRYHPHGLALARAHRASNCTMNAGACALEAHTKGKVNVLGGDLRHHQSDQTGGTDLADLRQAWAAYKQLLAVRSGSGWAGVKSAIAEGRGVVLQGDSEAFAENTCSGKYDGDHAIYISPVSRSVGGTLQWRINDSICPTSRWESAGRIKAYAIKLNPRVQFAVTRRLV